MNGVLVLAKGNATLGAVLEIDDEQPQFVFVIAHGNETSKKATLDVVAAAELSEWLAKMLKNPDALKKKKGSE